MQSPLYQLDQSLRKAGWYGHLGESKVPSIATWLRLEHLLHNDISSYLSRCMVDSTSSWQLIVHLIHDSPELTELRRQHFSGNLTVDRIGFDWIESTIRSIVDEKVFLELACRNGETLAFLKAHGAAQVLGATNLVKYPKAIEVLGEKNIVNRKVTDLDGIDLSNINKVNPDYILSCNLFDASRKGIPANFKYQVFDVFHQIGTEKKRPLIYVVGACDSRSLLSSADFQWKDDQLRPWHNLRFFSDCCEKYHEVRNFNVLSPAHMRMPVVAHASEDLEREILLGTSWRFRLSYEGSSI